MWTQGDNKVCYSGSAGVALTQPGVLTVGNSYHITFTISNMTQGKLILDSLEGKPEYYVDGEDITAFGVASSPDLTFIGEEYLGGIFDGCLDAIASRYTPTFTIKDTDGNTVLTSGDDNVGIAGTTIQYLVDWTTLDDGVYKIHFTDGGLEYVSDCFHVVTEHDCTKLLTWTNDDNAYGFDYSADFIQSLRVRAKKWHPPYKKNKEVFEDSQGNISILRSSSKKIELLTISEMPEYLHDALAIGVDHDSFSIDGIPYVVEETEYTPKWRNSSQLAPVEVEVIKKTQNLVNENCS
jgi:hypothetical protein